MNIKSQDNFGFTTIDIDGIEYTVDKTNLLILKMLAKIEENTRKV